MKTNEQRGRWNAAMQGGKAFSGSFCSTELAERYATPWDVPLGRVAETGNNIMEWLQAFCPPFQLFPGIRILDVGCGWSAIGRALVGEDVRYWGVDISDYAVARLREQFARYPNCRFDVVEGDGYLPFVPDKTIDLVVAKALFFHTSRAVCRSYCTEFARVLAVGGLYVFQVAGASVDPQYTIWEDDAAETLLPNSRVIVEKNEWGRFLQLYGRIGLRDTG